MPYPSHGVLGTASIFLSKEHARAQIVHCLASPSISDQLEQLEITHTGSDSTLINIHVFKSANVALLGLLWHPPGPNLE